MKKILAFTLSFAFFCFSGCKKEELTHAEILDHKKNNIVEKMKDVVPNSLISKFDDLINDFENQEDYDVFLDSIDNAYDDLVNTIETNYSIEEFREALDDVINNQQILKSNENDYLGPGYAKALELNLELSGSIGTLIYGGLHGGVGGGAKVIYDFVNMDRQIYYYTFCNYGFSIGIGLGATLSAGLGFTGINDIYTGIPYLPDNYCKGKFEGYSICNGSSIDLNVEAIFRINASIGIGSSYEAIGDFGEIGEWIPCPIDRIKIENGIKSNSFMIGGSIAASLGAEIAAAYSSDKLGANYHAIESSYDSYSDKRTLKGLLMAKELLLEGPVIGIHTDPSPFDLIASAMAIYYSLKRESDFPAIKPSIGTKGIDKISSSSAVGGGYIKYDGGAPIIELGLIWGLGNKMDLGNNTNKTSEQIVGPGFFESIITDLIPDTDYWAVAYAKNSAGKIGYGNDIKFSTLDQNNAPTAVFIVKPEEGTTETVFEFNATSSSDEESAEIKLQVRWDWENDGIWDTDYTTEKIINHTYSAAGSYTINMEVRDEGGLTALATHSVTVSQYNTSPTALFEVSPNSGTTNTKYIFDATGSSDSETPSDRLKIRWDWENDGIWDTNYTTEKIINHTYSTEGSYTINMEVRDEGNLIDNYTSTMFVSNSNTPPVAHINISPESGTLGTTFIFDASGSTDAETSDSELLVRWDFNNDKNWETSFSTNKIFEGSLPYPGIYTVKIEVKDEKGAIGTNTKEYTVALDGDGTFDYQNRTYAYKTIGSQTWMIENLAYLPSVSPPDEMSDEDKHYYVWGYLGRNTTEASSTTQYKKYGALYNWEAAKTACPSGWHLPSDDDWKTLEKYLGMSASDVEKGGTRDSGSVGLRLKARSGWGNYGNGINSHSFSAFPGGILDISDSFFYGGVDAFFWTSTSVTLDLLNYGLYRCLSKWEDGVIRNACYPGNGLSVRCLRD